jgi:hypothetical protein
VCNCFLFCSSLVLFFSTQLKVFISEVREWHSNWIIGRKPRYYAIRIVASGIGYSHSEWQLFIREKALVCGKKNCLVTSSQISVNISVRIVVHCLVLHISFSEHLLLSDWTRCVPTLFLESGNRFSSVLNMKWLTNAAILVAVTVWTVKANIVMFVLWNSTVEVKIVLLSFFLTDFFPHLCRQLP